MKIEDVRLGMPLVTTGGIPSTVVAISKEGGLWLETADRMRFPVHVECVRPVRDDWIEYNNNDGDIIAFRYIGRGIPKPIARDWMGRKTPQKYDMPTSQQLNEINRYLDHYRLKAELRNIGGIGTIMVVRRMI